MSYTIGETYIWKDCVGPTAFLNGMETTVTGQLEEWVDQDTLEVIKAQLTSTKCADSRSGFFVAEKGKLGKKAIRYVSQCQGKKGIANSEIAFRLAKKNNCSAYKCKYCGLWHTGGINRTKSRVKDWNDDGH